MRFGLFGSATARHGGPDVDSGQGYNQFVDPISRPRRSAIIRASWSSIISPASVRCPPACRCSPGWRRKPKRCASARPCWCCPGTIRFWSPSRPRPSICCPAAGSISASAKAIATTNLPASACRSTEADARFNESLDVIVKGLDLEAALFASRQILAFRGHHRRAADRAEAASADLDGRRQPDSIRQVAARGYNLLLDQFASFEAIAERIAFFKAASRERGRVFDPLEVGVARAYFVAKDRPIKKPHWNAVSRRNAVSPRSRTDRRHQEHSEHHGVLRYRARPAKRARFTAHRDEIADKLQRLAMRRRIRASQRRRPGAGQPAPLRPRSDAGFSRRFKSARGGVGPIPLVPAPTGIQWQGSLSIDGISGFPLLPGTSG